MEGRLDLKRGFVHVSCMATKTISLEIDAYERLKASKKPGESFSEVVRRAQFSDPVPTGKDLLEWMRKGGSGISKSYLDEIEEAEKNDLPPDDPWA